MPLIGDNPNEAVDEAAVAEIIENNLIEEYTRYASQLAPGFETLHELFAVLAINHKVSQKGVEIPRTSSPRLFILAVAPPRSGKSLSVKIAQRSIFTTLPVEQLATATPEGLAQLLSATINPPIIVIDEIGHSLATGYSRIDHFFLRAYDGTAWQHVVRNNPIHVPAERMRVSLVGMTTPQALSKAQHINQYALAGLFARFVLVSGNRTNPPDYVPRRPEFGIALNKVTSRVNRNSLIGFADGDARSAHRGIVDDILKGMDEDTYVFYAGMDEHMVKIATAYAIAEGSDSITEDHIERAGRVLEKCVNLTIDYVAELTKVTTRTEEIAVMADRIYDKVLREGGRALRSRVLRNLHIKAALARDAERVLLDEERLATITAVKPAFYCVPNTKIKCEECEHRRVCPLALTHL